MFGSAARPIFAEVKQRCWSAEERGVSYCFCEGRESGESGHFTYSSEKSASFFFWEYQKQTVQNLRCRRMELKWEDAPPGTGRRCLPDSEWMFYSPCPGNPFDCSRRSLRCLALGSHMGSCEASFLFYLSVLPLCCSLSCCVLDFDLQRSLRVSGPATTAGRDPQRACLDGSPPCPLLCV